MSRQGSGDRGSWVVPIIIALITAASGILVAIINNPEILERFSPERSAFVEPAPSEQDTVDNSESAASEQDIVEQPAPTDEPDPDPAAEASTDCVLTISNELVPLMSEPDTFSQEIMNVSSGDYPTSDFREVLFGDTQQGWFQIEADGRTGWVRNDTWTIADKTSGCP